MTSEAKSKRPAPMVLERSYEADVEDLWALWTTKDGFESWWGPQGFRVEVHALDLREGGELHYSMIAVGDDEVAFMKQAGMPLSHETHGTFAEIREHQRVTLRHVIDFVPGVETYEHEMTVEFFAEGSMARMVITINPYSDATWTERAIAGMTSQLTKVPAVLAARRG